MALKSALTMAMVAENMAAMMIPTIPTGSSFSTSSTYTSAVRPCSTSPGSRFRPITAGRIMSGAPTRLSAAAQ